MSHHRPSQRTASIVVFTCSIGLVILIWLFMPGGEAISQWGSDLVSSVQLPLVVRNSSQSPCFHPLLLSEVMVNPSGLEPDHEWFEIYNASTRPVNLSGFMVGDAAHPGDPEGMRAFPTDHFLGPGEAVVVANLAAAFIERYQDHPDYEIEESLSTVPNLSTGPPRSSGHIELNNTGDELVLIWSSGCIVDGLSWGSSIFAFDPPAKNTLDGASLERYPPGLDSDTAGDWRIQQLPSPGSVDLMLPTPTATSTLTETQVTPDVRTPTSTPKLHPVFVINEILADPDPAAGDVNGDQVFNFHQDQFVEIVNNSGQPVDLSNWKITAQLVVQHVFPTGSVLPDGCAVLVFGGGIPAGGFGGSLVQTASSGSLDLLPNGDSLKLLSPGGLSFTYTYGIEGAGKQSLTRSPDVTGSEPLIQHSLAVGANGALFSPGFKLDGKPFAGCPR